LSFPSQIWRMSTSRLQVPSSRWWTDRKGFNHKGHEASRRNCLWTFVAPWV